MKSATSKSLQKTFSESILADYLELTKPGITILVLASMMIGFILGSTAGIDFVLLFHAIIGTLLIAAGTAAHNQFIERDLDKLMVRTSKRPLPTSRIAPAHALLFSLSMILIGLVYLIAMVNLAAGLVSAVTSVMYLAIYTPMKRVSFSNVWIGAIPGALPPVGGWAAATGSVLEPGMWVLFGIVFLWQVPHVVAIAWLCNDDYIRAGFRMLPKNDSNGKIAALSVLGCLVLIIPVSTLLYTLGFNTIIYLIGAILAGLYFLYFGLKFWQERNMATAKKLMFASLAYLPLIWILIIADRLLIFFFQ